jgi:hypothetical protein
LHDEITKFLPSGNVEKVCLVILTSAVNGDTKTYDRFAT